MEQVDHFVTFMTAYELEIIIEEHETSPITCKFIHMITLVTDYCIISLKTSMLFLKIFYCRGSPRSPLLTLDQSTNYVQEQNKRLHKGIKPRIQTINNRTLHPMHQHGDI
jgi:hypothetical protein